MLVYNFILTHITSGIYEIICISIAIQFLCSSYDNVLMLKVSKVKKKE
jgi:hypothetical protein